MTATIVNGREIAQSMRKKIAEEITALVAHYQVAPVISTIMIGDDPASALYLKLRENACREVGITTKQYPFSNTVTEEKILQTIEQLNTDPAIHGILLQYPIPSHLTPHRLMSAITPHKDVEGLNPINLGKTLIGDETLVPCTPKAVLTIIEHEQIPLKGKDIVIVNHSTIVGKPLAALLLNRNATVAVCHVFTKNLQRYTSKADILITAAGVPQLITNKYVKKNAAVIDVAVIETKTGICGDVDVETVKEKVRLLTPVPGGVGPVTTACSLKNIITTYTYCMQTQ